MKFAFLPTEKLLAFIKTLANDGAVFYPVFEDGRAHLTRFDEAREFNPNFIKIRTAENVKHFFFPSRHTVATFPRDEKKSYGKTFLFGVKNCDLRGIDVYDRVFAKWEPLDAFYRELRDNILIISADCPEPAASCFCNIVGLNPYGEGICDMNFTQVSKGLLFQIFTQKGEELLTAHRTLFTDIGDKDERERSAIRKEAIRLLHKINDKTLKEDIPTQVNEADKVQIRKARDECVECHACLHCCPTCYCFLLSDYKKGQDLERIRQWDACYYAAYARVGGGANRRSRFDVRFWNRFQCKFNYFKQYESIYACSGCGRCLLGCSAKIDIREILWSV